MAEHMPAPWSLQGVRNGGWLLTDGRGYTICDRSEWPGRVEESEANARLIAAAPDMLAALKGVTVYLVEDDDRVWLSLGPVVIGSFDPDSPVAAALLQFDAQQRAAIAAAEGRSDTATRAIHDTAAAFCGQRRSG